MLRTVLFFYRRCIRQAWSDGWRRMMTESVSICWIYTMIFLQMLYRKNCLFLLVIPLYGSLILSRMYPNGVGVTEALMPFDEEERRRLVRQGYFFRVALSVMLYLVLAGFCFIKGWGRLPELLGIFLLEVGNFFAVNSYCDGGKKKRPESLTVWGCILLLLTCTGFVMFVVMQRDGISFSRPGDIAYVVFLAVLLVSEWLVAGQMIKKGREFCED